MCECTGDCRMGCLGVFSLGHTYMRDKLMAVVSSIIYSISNSFALLICHGPHISPGSFTLKETRARKSIPDLPRCSAPTNQAPRLNDKFSDDCYFDNFKFQNRLCEICGSGHANNFPSSQQVTYGERKFLRR